MSRRIFLQISAPAVVIGLLLFGTCLVSVWSINRLQQNLAHILSKHVASLEAAQELEISLRQLRYHSFIYVMDPRPDRLALIKEDNAEFVEALEYAKQSIADAEERVLLEDIETGYQRYLTELELALTDRPRGQVEQVRWADKHPVRHLQTPCEKLLALNKEGMERLAAESEEVSERARTTMVLLGLVAPVSGLLCGYGITRMLTRSIARLSVRLHDVHAHLDEEVGSLKLKEGADLNDLDKQLHRVVEKVRETAERVQRQQHAILRAEQLAAVGQLAASVAHEVRNPLTGMKLLIGAALHRHDSGALTLKDLEVIYAEIGRLEQTAQNLLDCARPCQVQRTVADMRMVLRQAVDLIRGRASQQRVQIQIEAPEQPVLAQVDCSQLFTVFANLLINALDAMPDGGTVDIRLEVLPNGAVGVSIRDTGPGVDAAVVERLFTPFVSTKPAGTGLGLSICRQVLEEHGGSITTWNHPEGGAVFAFQLATQSEEKGNAVAAGDR